MKNRLLAFLWITCLFVAVATAANKKFTLVIDAGHGGTDAGAVGSITKEKHINLNVALAFGRLVERNCPDVRVIYTRKTDVFVPLHTRADIAPFIRMRCPRGASHEDWKLTRSVCTVLPTIWMWQSERTRSS